MSKAQMMPFRATFYSYKGGAGRSVACANVAAHLVARGLTTVVADFDVESVGQSFIHQIPPSWMYGTDPLAPQWICVQEMLDGERYARGEDPKRETIQLGNISKLLPQLLIDVTISGQPSGFDPDARARKSPSKLLLMARPVGEVRAPEGRLNQGTALRTFLTRIPDLVNVVLFDSPSGTQPLANLSRNYSQALVVLCRPSLQFLQGTRYYLQRLTDLVQEDQHLEVLVVLSAVPEGPAFEKSRKNALDFAKDMVSETRELLKKKRPNVRVSMPSDSDAGERKPLVIPEVAQLKWNDVVLADDTNSDDDVKAGIRAYRRLAEVLEQVRQKTLA